MRGDALTVLMSAYCLQHMHHTEQSLRIVIVSFSRSRREIEKTKEGAKHPHAARTSNLKLLYW